MHGLCMSATEQNATKCGGDSTQTFFPNGTEASTCHGYCPVGWHCTTTTPSPPNATCELRNICSTGADTNVCPACQADYIHTQSSCDKCVAENCAYCDPKGPRGCANACDACCHDYVDDCGACVKEKCQHAAEAAEVAAAEVAAVAR
jgi:hypothetical protein